MKKTIVLQLLKQGKSTSMINRMGVCSREYAYKIKNSLLSHLLVKNNKFKCLPQRGRDILRKRVKDKIGAPGVRQLVSILAGHGINVSHMTISRYLRSQKWGKSFKAKKKLIFTIKNIKDRKRFTRCITKKCTSKNWPQLEKYLMFTDESRIGIFCTPNTQNIRIRTENPDSARCLSIPKYDNVQVQVCAGLTSKGLTDLYIFDGSTSINSDFYVSNILPIYLQSAKKLYKNDWKKVILQEDGSTAHTTKISRKWVAENWKGGVLMPKSDSNDGTFFWPGNSPHLNVIENCWSGLKKSV